MPAARKGPAAADVSDRSGRRRYWAAQVDLERQSIWLDADEAHHVRRVMRARPGDRIEVIDGSGRLFEVEIEGGGAAGRGGSRLATVRRRESRLAARIVKVSEPPEGGPLPWLAPALIRPARLEMLVDLSTQLGLGGIQLFVSARSVAPLSIDRAREKRLVRLMRTATAQSLGLRLPELRRPVAFSALGDALAGFQIWVAHPVDAGTAPRRRPAASGSSPALPPATPGMPHVLVVGPEGGLTEAEVDALLACGAQLLDLGPRRLRSETAALSGLTLLAAALRAAADRSSGT